ncbi:MAG: glycosyltransferase [Bacteroidales bacterium]|nr:glycosyltransferase [Bacteroidales bacterium]
MSKVLFFFTSNYPYGKGETFIENEIEHLSKAFDKIIIISNDTTNLQTRKTPKNCAITRFNYELSSILKLLSFLEIGNSLFWREMKIIRRLYKLKTSKIIFNTLIITLQKKYIFKKRIKNIISQQTSRKDEVYLYSYWANDMAIAIASIKSKKIIKKRFCRAHRWDLYLEENRSKYLPLREYLLKNIDIYASISSDGCRYNHLLLGSDYPSVKLSRLGVQSRIFKKCNINNFTILSLSNLIDVKNIKTLIHALSILEIDFNWIHIGDGVLKQELIQLAELKIPNKYTYVGALSNQEVMDYMSKKNISLFINVSLSEGIPVSIMEAMSFGIPCVATAVGGTPEIVNDGYNGFLLSPNPTAVEIADMIEKFYNLSYECKENMHQNAFYTWENEYNAEKNYSAFINQILSN